MGGNCCGEFFWVYMLFYDCGWVEAFRSSLLRLLQGSTHVYRLPQGKYS